MMAETPPKAPQQVQVTPVWRELEKHAAMAANAFLLQQTGQEFILTVGFAALPYFARPEEALAVRTVDPQVISRLVMTPGRVVELMGMLQQALAQYQEQQKH
jgi:hypothetical protein